MPKRKVFKVNCSSFQYCKHQRCGCCCRKMNRGLGFFFLLLLVQSFSFGVRDLFRAQVFGFTSTNILGSVVQPPQKTVLGGFHYKLNFTKAHKCFSEHFGFHCSPQPLPLQNVSGSASFTSGPIFSQPGHRQRSLSTASQGGAGEGSC